MKKSSLINRLFLYKCLLEIRLFKKNYYFIKNKHVGDIVRTLPAISLFKECHLKHKRAKIIVLTTANKVGLMEMNKDIDEVRILSSENLLKLENYCRADKNINNLFRDAYAVDELGPIYNFTKEYIDAHSGILTIPNRIGEESEKKAKAFLAKRKLDPLKTLLLVPYAASSSSLDVDSIKSVVKFYLASGYRVLTNAYGEGQKIADGSELLDVPADVLLSLIRQGMTVISVQCGIADSCAWMNLSDRLIKIYILKTERDRYYFSKRKMNTEQKIKQTGFGYTVVVSTDQDCKDLNENLIRLSKLLIGNYSVQRANPAGFVQ